MAKIKIMYEVEDGYVGPSAPHSFTINSENFEGLTSGEIELDLTRLVQEHFEQTISWHTHQPISAYAISITEAITREAEA